MNIENMHPDIQEFLAGLEAVFDNPFRCDRCGGLAKFVVWMPKTSWLAFCNNHYIPGSYPQEDITVLNDKGFVIPDRGLIPGQRNLPSANHSGAYGRPCMCPTCRQKK